MKRLLLGGGVFLLCLTVSLSSSSAVVDRIVAIVNQEIITLAEIERWGRSLQQEIRADDRLERRYRIRETLRTVLDRMIEERLLEQEARKLGLKVTEKEIEAALDEVKQKNRIDQEGLKQALLAEGLTLEVFKKEIERKILRTKFVTSAVKVDQKAGEKEWMEFFQKNLHHYCSEESYRPAHILFVIPKEATAEQVRQIRKKAQTVLKQIKEGADFAKMAMAYSDDPSSKGEGGDLGYFKKGELLPALEKEAMRLQAGEVGEIIRTELGFHILKLLDRKGGVPLPFEEVKERVKADYYQKEFEKGLQTLLDNLKERAVIEIKL